MKKKSSLIRKKNIKKAARKRRWRYLWRGVFALAFFGGIVFGGHEALRRLDLFTLKHISIQGDLKTLSEAEILRRSGVQVGVNLFSLDLPAIQGKLKEHPFFKSVVVHRQLPNGLVLEIKEYSTEFILNTGRLYYVDADGDIYKDITETDDKRDFPVLSGISQDMILAEPQKAKEAIQLAVQLKNEYKKSEFYPQNGISEINFEKNIGFTLYPEKQKYSIKFGLKDFSDKVKKLSEFWLHAEGSSTKISSIDLNYPGKILMSL